MPPMTARLSPRAWLALAGIYVAVAAAYFPALRGGLLWDDDAHLTRPELRSLSGLGRIWFELGATQQYYPILHTAFWVEHRLWGDATLGYHLINVLLHATAAGLFFLLLRRLAVPGAWLAGLIFALHPVGVESVAWISEQKNTLSTVCYLLAAWAILDFDSTRRRRSYLLGLVLFALALLSKSVTATLPAALLVVYWWRRGRLSWRKDILPLLPFFALALAAGLFTAWVERHVLGAEGADYALGFPARCLLAGRVVWFYLGKLLWPANLIFIYPRWEVSCRCTRVLRLAAGRAGRSGRALAPATPDPAPGRGALLCRFAFPRPRFFQRLSLSVFVCRRSFPVSGEPGPHRPRGGRL